MTSFHLTPIGYVAIDSNETHITSIRSVISPDTAASDDAPILRSAIDWLDQYFSGKRPSYLPPLAPEGTSFQKLIWSLLLRIPYGESVTYGSLAKKAAQLLGKETMSAQAVGGAVGRNPILIMIPCHRVLGVDNKLTGFSAGIEKKIHLLQTEGIDFRR
ncbi:MAG: methylated-DNA--[Oscillospiraceae bacterium]|nr:methylated-DNA--[protein]-cysteine S-methyltransferase [Oscillospiraceae bacterium]